MGKRAVLTLKTRKQKSERLSDLPKAITACGQKSQGSDPGSWSIASSS